MCGVVLFVRKNIVASQRQGFAFAGKSRIPRNVQVVYPIVVGNFVENLYTAHTLVNRYVILDAAIVVMNWRSFPAFVEGKGN
jgi:hypothetical protein